MKRPIITKFAASVLILLVGACPCVLADAGVFTGNGQNLHQITSKTIQLVGIDVTIVLGRGPFLFDGTVPGMDRAEYMCKFVLRNLSDQEAEVKVGFPVDSQFARASADSPEDSGNWVLEYGFIARDEKATYHVAFVRQKAPGGPGKFGSVFVWNMRFSPNETRTLSVQYRIPMSMGLVPMQKEQNAPPMSGVFGQEFLNIGQLDMAGYVTSTGSSWAGNVETAKFTLVTEPFERYLSRRGITEQSASQLKPEELDRFSSTFPVRHPWWFRQIGPAGWQQIEGGVQWKYKDFKPKDPIEVRYYTTPFPQLAEEVGPFVDRFLGALAPGDSSSLQLGRLKQVLLATYGCEPNDETAKQFVSQQLWYKPRKNCSLAQLGPGQQAVLQEIDKRAAEQH